ncbi:MAG: 4Fe-4S dicluster domain-containing protein, partial [Candidatus Heimdallarchaeaceae archaeon]
MDSLTLPKEKLLEMLAEIAAKFTLIGPKEETGFTEFQELDDPKDINLDYLLSRVPPKSLFFQQTETLFAFTKGKNAKVETPKADPGKRIIFGIRPCDARGYSLLDPVMDGKKEGDYQDPFYVLRKNRSTLIGLSCNEPEVNCFCTSFGDSPANTKYLDLLFTDLGDKYYIDVITEKGEELIKNLSKMFS